MKPRIELIVPAYNEGAQLAGHLDAILAAATPAPASAAAWEIRLLVIDDGSQDDTAAVLEAYCAREPRARYLSFTRNFGKEAAISAGLAQADPAAAAVILLDSDLQHPPELIPDMIRLWQGGARVVHGVKCDRGRESHATRLAAALFYRLFYRLAGLDIRQHSDFKLLDREVVAAYLALPERNRFFRGLIHWFDYPSASLPFSVPPRIQGTSRWPAWSRLRYAIDNLTAFSAWPLTLIGGAGLLSLLLGLALGGLALWQKFQGEALSGFTTVILLQVIFGGLLMLSLGIIGHYLACLYDEIKARPSYVLRPPGTTRTPSAPPMPPTPLQSHAASASDRPVEEAS